MTLRYTYTNDGRRILISKEVMKNRYKVDSPNLADACLMATENIGEIKIAQDMQYETGQDFYREENLFKITGVR